MQIVVTNCFDFKVVVDACKDCFCKPIFYVFVLKPSFLSFGSVFILILWQHCRWLGLGKDSIFTQNRLNMSRHLVHKHFMVLSKTNIERKVTFSNVVTELTSLSSAPAPLRPDAVVNVTHHIMGHILKRCWCDIYENIQIRTNNWFAEMWNTNILVLCIFDKIFKSFLNTYRANKVQILQKHYDYEWII